MVQMSDGPRTPEHQDENSGTHRRRDDHPDWKMAAPRWLLVIIAGVFAAVMAVNVKRHVDKTELAAVKLHNVETDVEVVKRKARAFECGLLETRVDVLTYQEYMARKNKDIGFATELKKRKETAENLLRHRQETRECNGG